jgi:hypothetical protein
MAIVNPKRFPAPNVITDNGGFTTADVIDLSNYDGLAVAIVDGNGNQISSFGGGTQYVSGTVQATPTGTVALAKSAANVLQSLSLDTSGNLNVNLAAGTISGGNAAASGTGMVVPANADYTGLNVAGILVGQTGISLTNAVAASVAIVDGNGNQITSFGGGTQYADSAASGLTPTGTLDMGWDSANSKIRALKVDTSQNLYVNVANASLAVTGTFWQATQPVSGTVAVSGISGSVTVTGAVSVSNFPATQPVSGTVTANQGTTNVTPWNVAGTVAVSSISGSVAVTGAFYQATQPISGSVSVSNFPSSQAVTGTFWQATQPVSISGTVATSSAQLPASLDGSGNLKVAIENTPSVTISGAVAVTGTFWQTTQPISGSVSVSNFPATQPISGTVSISGTVPVSGTFWQTTQPVSIAGSVPVTGTFWPTTQPISGTVTAQIEDSLGNSLSSTANALNVNVQNSSIAVTGAFYQATQPVSISGSVPISGTVTVANGALETGGNLATAASTLVFQNVTIDLLTQLLAHTKYHNMLLGSNMNAGLEDLDSISATLIQ